MKTFYKSICFALIACLSVSCVKENISGLSVLGNCDITALTLNDKFVGIIDSTTQTVKVKVPVDYNQKGNMKITKLAVSAGAKASIAEGETANFNEARNIKVTNGDVFLDWTVRVKNDEAKILSFMINGTYKARVDEATKTIIAKLPRSVDVTKITPTIELSEDATVFPRSGVTLDFSSPVEYEVTDNTATAVYTVYVETITAPTAIFLGSNNKSDMDELVGEEREACKWMLANIDNSLFVPWADLRNNAIDLSKCEVIFWHWQNQPSESLGDFENGASGTAMSCLPALVDYYNNGGAFVLGRAAVNFAAKLGAVKDGLCANNCWGATDDGGEILAASWDLPAYDESSYLWQGIVGGFPVKLLDAGYQISNCVSQWLRGSFDTYEGWEAKTGCKVLAHGGDGAISIWEAPAADGTFGKGGIVCFGSGCYDWYSPNPFTEVYHVNMGIITGNAFNHLMGK